MLNSVEEKLKEAFAELATKEAEKISVSALCEKADVSRASFYIHYKDLDDFVSKSREYIIDKLFEQFGIIFSLKKNDKYKVIFTEKDIALLKGFIGNHVYWDFAIDANSIIGPRFKKLMIERYGEAFYSENKEKFEFLLNGGIALLCLDLMFYNKETYIKNIYRIAEIANKILFEEQ